MSARSTDGGIDNDSRTDASERSFYRLLAYVSLSWIVLYELGQRLLPEYLGGAAAFFAVAVGSWFLDNSKRSKMSLLSWTGACALGAAIVAGFLYALDRIWPVV